MKIKTSAPGKLMLLGDHAVVYDYPCIATSVASRIYVEAERSVGGLKIDAPQVKDVRFVEETVRFFNEKYKIKEGLTIKTYSDFSSKYGLGSSSAVTTAIIYALSNLFEIEISKHEIFDLGYKVVLSIQGVGSGFDIAAATYGGTIYFVTGGKVIEPLSIDSLPLIIGYSGVKGDTSTIVKNLKLKIASQKSEIFKIFDDMRNIVEKAKIKLKEQDWKSIGQLMNQNQKLLQLLNVSTDKLDIMCQVAVSAGAYGAKLSGAGGGDCMIALAPEDKIKNVESAITQAGGLIIRIEDNTQGVRLEKI